MKLVVNHVNWESVCRRLPKARSHSARRLVLNASACWKVFVADCSGRRQPHVGKLGESDEERLLQPAIVPIRLMNKGFRVDSQSRGCRWSGMPAADAAF